MKINQLSKCAGIGVFFLFANLNAQSTEKAIRNFISSDVSFANKSNVDFRIINEDHSASMKSNIVNVQQYHGNTPIYKSLAKAILKEGNVISFNNNFQKVSTNVVADKIDKSEALASALRFLDIKDSGFQLMDEKDGDLINLPDDKVASVRFFFQRENTLIPAQLFFINQSKDNKFFGTLVSLTTGEILENNKMIDECSFDSDHSSDEASAVENHLVAHFNSNNNKNNSANKHNKAATDASYSVFAFPIEAPTFGAKTVVTNPWDLAASPEGWHSNGTVNYTNTYGNNVLAYVDNNASNTAGFSPVSTTTGSLSFDFPFAEDAALSAYDNRASAVTNLFYANNMIHDIMYKFGFTETSRNFQSNNFGKGGGANDAVRAEAFDGSGYNNANFASGFEILNGSGTYTTQAPRMQMYLWNQGVAQKKRLFYTDPALAARPAVNTGVANYGRQLMETGITADIVIPADVTGCTAMTAGSLAGKIAMVNSVTASGCGYNIKAKTAQDAGAIGLIVHRSSNVVANMNVNNVTNVSIPSIMIPKDEGDFITAEITAGRNVNVNLKDLAVGYKNSSFDNGVMVHEYGHGVSNRLTGQGYNCLTNLEQMGEGWSDFFALMLTNTPGYTASTPRGIATYSSNTPTTAGGIRQYRYTTNMSVNPHTYADTNSTGGQPHAVGEIWATVLWDLHWAMAAKYGYNYDITADANSGSAKALQLVMDGLKLQPCNPNFVSGRDAIIQADQVAGGTDNCLIWNVFAKRGLGLNASAGTATSISDQVEDFTVPAGCILATEDIAKNKAFGIYPNPAKGEFFIKAAPTVGNATIKVEILDLNGKLIRSIERKKNSSDAISTKGLIRGTYLVVVTENGKSTGEKLIVQ